MSKRDITVIDYGMGNLWSVLSAIKFLGYEAVVSSDPIEIGVAEILVLPGVGSFRKAMNSLIQSGLDQAIKNSLKNNDHRILGICLGMQLMGNRSSEDGDTIGLGLIQTSVEKFMPLDIGVNKIPHIGFDQVNHQPDSRIFNGIENSSDFYFVHSYRMLPAGLIGKVATCNYGSDFLAAYEQDNIFATQFHPEKSQTNGLILLKNFLDL
jgi:glutamine amidotransferase